MKTMNFDEREKVSIIKLPDYDTESCHFENVSTNRKANY